jgi:hypothetical protein
MLVMPKGIHEKKPPEGGFSIRDDRGSGGQCGCRRKPHNGLSNHHNLPRPFGAVLNIC